MCIQKRANGLPPCAQCSARPRSRGAGTRGRCRRRGCRSSRRGAPRPSPSTRCASPGGRGPTGYPSRAVVRVGRLPQHEVAGVALVGRDLDARAGEHVVGVAAARAGRTRAKLGDGEQHVAFGRVGVARRDEALDHRDDLRRCDRWRAARRRAARRRARAVLVDTPRGSAPSASPIGTPFACAACVDLVVDVGDVAGVGQRCTNGAAAAAARRTRRAAARCRCARSCRPSARRHTSSRVSGRQVGRLERLAGARQRVMEKKSHRRAWERSFEPP